MTEHGDRMNRDLRQRAARPKPSSAELAAWLWRNRTEAGDVEPDDHDDEGEAVAVAAAVRSLRGARLTREQRADLAALLDDAGPGAA